MGPRASLRRDEGGFTLVEMLVTVILMGIVGTIVTNIMLGSFTTSRKADDQTRSLTAGKIAMERITRAIRGANSVTSAQPRYLRFVYTVAGTRTDTTFQVVTNTSGTSEIRETDIVTVGNGLPTTTTKTVLGGLAVGRSDAVFHYEDGGGTALTPTSMSPETYDPAQVKSVQIGTLMIRLYNAPPLQMQQTVSIRNLEE